MTSSDGEMAGSVSADMEAARCCAPVDPRIARRFDKNAAAWVGRDELPALVRTSACLLELLGDAAVRRPSVLELGSGSGGLSVALLEAGATRVTGVDLSLTSVEVARERAARAGLAGQATFQIANAVEAQLARHDWVVLDRVICCFSDLERMVGRAIELAVERIAISVPESRGLRGLVNRPVWAAENAWDLLHGGCPAYVHDVRQIDRQLAQAGFLPVAARHVRLWHVGVYERHDRPKLEGSRSSGSHAT